jgi:hypothetical protein
MPTYEEIMKEIGPATATKDAGQVEERVVSDLIRNLLDMVDEDKNKNRSIPFPLAWFEIKNRPVLRKAVLAVMRRTRDEGVWQFIFQNCPPQSRGAQMPFKFKITRLFRQFMLVTLCVLLTETEPKP